MCSEGSTSPPPTCGSTPTRGVRAIPPQGILRCLHWSHASGELRPIQSNGLLFGVWPDTTYPVHDLLLGAGDHLLLYTDGLIEPENTSGEPFGDHRLEEVAREHQACPAGDLSNRLLDGLRAWQAKPGSQEDDITLVVIDVL